MAGAIKNKAISAKVGVEVEAELGKNSKIKKHLRIECVAFNIKFHRHHNCYLVNHDKRGGKSGRGLDISVAYLSYFCQEFS